MKRLHVHVAVVDLDTSINFYSHLFATAPTVHKADYAKWMLDDPRVNFAISSRGAKTGIEHLGIQAETSAELADVHGRLMRADRPVLEEGTTNCCYARSEKSWIEDPQGVKWETFLTTGESTTYGRERVAPSAPACCAPTHETALTEAPEAGTCCTPSQKAQAVATGAACCG